jgi:hypothetical protein
MLSFEGSAVSLFVTATVRASARGSPLGRYA